MRKIYECGKCHNFFEDGAGKTLAVRKNNDIVIPCTCAHCRGNNSPTVSEKKKRERRKNKPRFRR